MNLMKNANFYPTFWTQLLGAFNDNLFKNAFIILLTFKLSSGAAAQNLVVLAGGLFVLPFFLFSAFAGELSDKYPKHKLSRNLKLLELGIVVLGSYGFIFHHTYILFICLFLLGTQSALYGPIKYSILPELLPEESLVKANAFVEMGTFLAILAGTILGGVLIDIPQGESWISASCLFLAVLGYLTSLKIPALQPIDSTTKVSWNFIKLNQKNFQLVYPQKNIFLTILAISWFWLLGACLLSIFPVLVKDHLHGQEAVVTFLLAIFSIGIAVGSLLCEKLSHKHLELGLVPLGSLGMFVFLLDLYFSLSGYTYTGPNLTVREFINQPYAVRILMDLTLFSICGGFFTVPLYTYLQIRTKREERSRIVACNNILNAFFMVAGSVLLFGLFSLKLSLPHVILVLAAMTLATSAYIYFFMPEFLWRLMSFFLTHVIYKFKTVEIPKVSPDQALIFTSNHVSFIDWLLISAAISRPVRFVMDDRIYRNPILGFFFRSAKVIPITSQKNNPEVYEKAFASIKEALKNQEIICIFPEGRISEDGGLKQFKSGIERIVKESPSVPVQPLVIKGMYGSFFSRSNQGKAFSNPWLLIKNFKKAISVQALPALLPGNISAQKLEDVTKESLQNPS